MEKQKRVIEGGVSAKAAPATTMREGQYVDIVFTGEGPNLTFVEVEDAATRRSMNVGSWVNEKPTEHRLRIPNPYALPSINDARAAIAAALRRDPDFKRGCIKDVAVILRDRLEVADETTQDIVAKEILQRLFGP